MNHLKTHHTPTSAIELQRAYVYLPTTHWAAVEALRASTTLSVSQMIAHLITAAIAAKDTHDRSRTTH